MMNKRNKFLAGITFLFLLLYLLTGCFSGSDKESSQLKSLDSVDVKNLKPVTLTFWFPGAELGDTKKVLKEINKKIKNKINAKIEFKFLDETGQTRYADVMSAKLDANDTYVDAFYCYGQDYINFSPARLESKGKLKDITRLFPRYAPELYKKYSKEEIQSGTVDGKLVTIPNLSPEVVFNYAIIREDLRKKYNIPGIKNYSDYELYIKTIKEKEPDFSTVPINRNILDLFASAYGYVILDQDMGLLYKWNDPAMEIIPFERAPEFNNFIKMIKRWYDSDYFELPDKYDHMPVSDREELTMELMRSGKIAYFIGNVGIADIINNNVKKIKGSDNPEFKAYLLYPGSIVQRENPVSGGSIAFNQNSKNAERALMFMEWIQQSQENYDLLMYGIKGVHYDLDNREAQKSICTDKSQFYMGWPCHEVFENLKLSRFIGSSSYFTDKEKSSYENTILNKSKYAPHTGFIPDCYESKMGRFGPYEYINNILTGLGMDSEEEKQHNESTDAISKDVQKQLDKWKSEYLNK